MNCPKCNNKLVEGASFCTECGTKIEKQEEFIFCEECGNKLSKDSSFCTECGTKVGATPKKEEKKVEKKTEQEEVKEDKKVVKKEKSNDVHTATLIVSRKKSFKGCAITFHVLVDGVKVGDLKNGASITYELTEGIHKVTISTVDKDTDQPVEVTKDRNSIEIITVAKMGLVAAKASIEDIIFK